MSENVELREVVRSFSCRLSEIEGELRVLRAEVRDNAKAMQTDAQKDVRGLWIGLSAIAIGTGLALVGIFGGIA